MSGGYGGELVSRELEYVNQPRGEVVSSTNLNQEVLVMSKSNYPTNVIATGKTYIVGAVYKATPNHLINALLHGVQLPLDGQFTCTYVDDEGGCWSKDAIYLGDEEIPIKGVGILCAPAFALKDGDVAVTSQEFSA